MTPATERRAVAFVRTFANRCHSCTHRRPEICNGCQSQWANEILRDVEAEMKPVEPNYSLATRRVRILDALQRAGRPVLASEIDLSDVCSKHLKKWTLLRMVRDGFVMRTRNDDPCDRRLLYRYFLPTTQKEHNNGQPNARRGRYAAHKE